jgi:putative oxidoreductase
MKVKDIATIALRLALSAGFLSAVASRLGFWGKRSLGWKNFLVYTGEVNSFLPKYVIAPIAVTSTLLELVLGILLFVGFKTKYAAFGAALLTLFFAVAMSYSFGIKEALDYSVFTVSAGALLLGFAPFYAYSIDKMLSN